jgi:hypothetical protein
MLPLPALVGQKGQNIELAFKVDDFLILQRDQELALLCGSSGMFGERASTTVRSGKTAAE